MSGRRLFGLASVILLWTTATVVGAGHASTAPGPIARLVDGSTGQWHVRDAAGTVTTFYFGNPGDFPIMGDWDCDGIETPGMYRRSDGYVYLANANRSQIADVRFFFGDPNDIPLAGDFDGDGCDTVSVYRPGDGRFFIVNALGRNDGGLGAADLEYTFGDPGDKAFTGDFDGDGVDTVGLHRESTGLVYFNNEHRAKTADHSFVFGDPGDRIVAGDWDGDGIDSPGLYRPGTATFYFRYTNTQGTADAQVAFGEAGWVPPGSSPGVQAITPPTTTSTTTTTVTQGLGPDCHPSYIPCVPYAIDVDCRGGSGDGPVYTGRVTVVGPDVYDLDRDNDGIGCERS